VLFRNGDADDLATRLAGLLDDPVRRGVLAGSARAAVRRYDWATVAARIVQVYETVTEGGR
jgi:phosphatidylinositol alpha-mannosyltransferase